METVGKVEAKEAEKRTPAQIAYEKVQEQRVTSLKRKSTRTSIHDVT